jgi:hypothetical protein
MTESQKEDSLERARLKAIEFREKFANYYFQGLLDFLKWTTTFAFGSMLWFGINIGAFKGFSKFVIVCAFAFLILSILFSLYTITKILFYWHKTWNFHYTIVKSTLRELEPDEFQKLFSKEKGDPHGNPKYFHWGLIAHITTILLGLLFYMAAVLMSQ